MIILFISNQKKIFYILWLLIVFLQWNESKKRIEKKKSILEINEEDIYEKKLISEKTTYSSILREHEKLTLYLFIK